MVKNFFSTLMRVLEILWMRFWFLLIPMRFLLRFENSISDSDMDLLVMMEALLLRILIAGFVYSYSSPKIEENSPKIEEKNRIKEKNLPSEESTDSKESQELVLIYIFIERIEEDYTEFSEEGYPQDYEKDLFMDFVHYPFRDVDLNIRYINGFDTRGPFKNWSLGKVYFIKYEDRDINEEGEIVWVWVQIHLYYPMPMPTPFKLQCRLSEDLGAHPISKGDFVLLEYDAKRDEERFLNRTFTIIKIENN